MLETSNQLKTQEFIGSTLGEISRLPSSPFFSIFIHLITFLFFTRKMGY